MPPSSLSRRRAPSERGTSIAAPSRCCPTLYPLFDPQDKRHLQLAELSRRCHQRVAGMQLSQSRAIGRLRQEVREALREELQEIDRLARELLGL